MENIISIPLLIFLPMLVSFLIMSPLFTNNEIAIRRFTKAFCAAMVSGLNLFSANTFIVNTNKAKKKRGFNQAELLAKGLQERCNVPSEKLVEKAKETRCMAEKMITLGKENTLHTRRQALGYITKEDVVTKVFNEIAPKYADRNGGYTRIYKVGPRRGDAAEVAIIELV